MTRKGSAALERYVFDLSTTEWAEMPRPRRNQRGRLRGPRLRQQISGPQRGEGTRAARRAPRPARRPVRARERRRQPFAERGAESALARRRSRHALAVIPPVSPDGAPGRRAPGAGRARRWTGRSGSPPRRRERTHSGSGDLQPERSDRDLSRLTLLAELLSRLPEHVHVLLDEAIVHFQDREDEDACLRLVEEFPRLVVFRSFSNAYGLSGLRAGYAVGSLGWRTCSTRSHLSWGQRGDAGGGGMRAPARETRSWPADARW